MTDLMHRGKADKGKSAFVEIMKDVMGDDLEPLSRFEMSLLERIDEQGAKIAELSERVESLASMRKPRPEVLTVKQVAEELQCDPGTVLDLVNRKVLKILPRKKLPGVGRGKRGSPIKVIRKSLDVYKGATSF